MGWKITIIDGKGSDSGWLSAWNQALALKPDGIIGFTSADAVQAPIQQAKSMGIPVVGVLSAAKPGPDERRPVHQRLAGSGLDRQGGGAVRHRQSNGTARAVIVYDELYAIARYKAEAMKAEIGECAAARCWNTSPRRRRRSSRTPASSFRAGSPNRARADMDSHGRRRVRRFHGEPAALRRHRAGQSDDRRGGRFPAAYSRIRKGDYQVVTAPQPQTELGYQAVDEMVRALQPQPASGYAPDVYIVDK